MGLLLRQSPAAPARPPTTSMLENVQRNATQRNATRRNVTEGVSAVIVQVGMLAVPPPPRQYATVGCLAAGRGVSACTLSDITSCEQVTAACRRVESNPLPTWVVVVLGIE